MKSPIDLVIMPKTLPETSRAKRGYQGAIVSETPTLNELIPDIEPRGEDDVRIRGSTDRLPEAVFDRRGKVNCVPSQTPLQSGALAGQLPPDRERLSGIQAEGRSDRLQGVVGTWAQQIGSGVEPN